MSGDFSKKPPRAVPTDDQAPPPIGPTFDVPETVAADQSADEIQEAKDAAPFWHPAWETVQAKFEEKINAYGESSNALVLKDKPADEFKIDMIVAAIVTAELTEIMEDVKRAVESIERRPKPAKSTIGGK